MKISQEGNSNFFHINLCKKPVKLINIWKKLARYEIEIKSLKRMVRIRCKSPRVIREASSGLRTRVLLTAYKALLTPGIPEDHYDWTQPNTEEAAQHAAVSMRNVPRRGVRQVFTHVHVRNASSFMEREITYNPV